MRTIGDPAALAAIVARLERLTARQARRWGRMSAPQMVAHLLEVTGAVVAGRPIPGPPRRPSRMLKLAALYLPLPWPRGIRSGTDPASRPLADCAFDADRRRTIGVLRDLAAAPERTLLADHPLFGPMTRRDWHRWAYLHCDHHLRQFGA
jgi:hypothetical protein